MSSGLIITSIIVGVIVGVGTRGSVKDWWWWATIISFWVATVFRDYYLRGNI